MLFAAVGLFACARTPGAASVSKLAVARSNQEARRLYRVEPFQRKDGEVRVEGQYRVWEALTSIRGNDMTAKVVVDEQGSVVSVDVRMLAHPTAEPSPKVDQLMGPDKTPVRRGIPEVMPK